MRQMESAFEAFVKHEERVRSLQMRPSEYVRPADEVHAVPDGGRRLDHRAGRTEVAMFNSDYPHVEGGRRPIERFERSLGDAPESVRQAFYSDNFLALMGRAARHLAAA
jgi:hypothetical protein